MKKTNEMKPKNDFGKWLLDSMIKNEFTCSDIANKLHTTRQAVRNHVNGIVLPSYVWVIAYCSLFDENPDDIWELVQ